MAIVLAYLLECRLSACSLLAAPAAGRRRLYCGFRRYIATDGVRGTAYRLAQGIYLIRDMPGMLNKLSDFAPRCRAAIRR